MATFTYQVTGMTCGHCERSVREEVSQIPGVEVLDVSATNGTLSLSADSVDDAAVREAVNEAGYEAARA
ncbi:heavy-metal-associated domain-containing protein [Microbacterium sediminicola]|uniref:Heavy-metal-associated domain-containing protein n=1 Tax=Microbacterium sediminicola TaxID=415210 RepID=A0ABP4TGX6_9MICO